ncbi:hypothetical protein NUW58_g2081 [Xylaria curta]|uniref:Uncharacterized protein n=1 Tax=Xylaria curta TaxID=42375 RepID=A0ACC1PJU9_9PEZI|nr:hypothetical protein NUW58_g2081 [Xylaria curta]
MAPRKNAPSAAAELSLVHLKNCLVNLPASLVNLLDNVNTLAQNVVIELNYRPAPTSDGSGQPNSSSNQRSIYVGWTGVQSKRKLVPIVDRDGITNGRDREVSSVEIDATLATTLGLSEGQKVMAIIHIDPPLAHTVNIEPLTPEDWEIIELHATFLELNMLSQIRAVPNPTYAPSQSPSSSPHALTLHLSPTSTANIKVLSLTPAPSGDIAFVKIAPDAEVIVAPKTRAQPSKSSRESRSVGGTSRRSGKSSASTIRRRSTREEKKPALYLRAVDRGLCSEWFDDEPVLDELNVWIDRDLLLAKEFRGVNYVTVNIVKPAGLYPPSDPQQQQQDAAYPEAAKSSERVIVHLRPWNDPPSSQSVALSTPLCAALGCVGIVGGVAKIEPAPQPSSRSTAEKLKIFPFTTQNAKTSGPLKFGGESKAEKEGASKRIAQIYSTTTGSGAGLLNGLLTDGMILGVYDALESSHGWEGGVIRFETSTTSSSPQDGPKWYLGSERPLSIDVQPPIPRPTWLDQGFIGEDPCQNASVLVGIDSLLDDLVSHLIHMSSVLLTGALGSGKTSVAKNLLQTLRKDYLFHTTYFPCRKLMNDESRISTIKETLNRIFMAASWGARLGGKAIVILDDIDKLCPAETELQVGNNNGRSRQTSEIIGAIVRQYCGRNSGVVLLATAQGKDSLNNVIIGGHIVREIVDLKAPDKEGRRRVLDMVVKQHTVSPVSIHEPITDGSRPTTADGSIGEDAGTWMDGGSQPSPSKSSSKPGIDGFLLDPDLDFLDLAGETDGYMPGDLILLVSRARNEALIRSVGEMTSKLSIDVVQLGRVDFDRALKGFTPASLRNVTLQSSTTTFDSIGGLKETRQILLETLQYPTKYAPIFAQCPLRLRSGLLLYGYPGCGKTLLASAVAGECGLNFISVKGPEILNKYIGASEKSIRDLFERASAAKPCVLFFDEFDSIAPKRGHDSTGVTDRVVNQLLTQMDGAEGLSGVYVLAATSRPDLIDPALLRPGRLDKSLLCDFPSLEDRIDILQALGKKVKLDGEILSSEDGLIDIGRRTEGFSGADLQALMSNAQLEAIHDVLNELESQPQNGGRGVGNTRDKSTSLARARNFMQFRYGAEMSLAEAEDRAKKGNNRSAQIAENAAIATKLAEIKAARKRARLGNQGASSADEGHGQKEKSGKDTEVLIGWKHITKALESTRASISSQERSRLERIYHEFVPQRYRQHFPGSERDQGDMERLQVLGAGASASRQKAVEDAQKMQASVEEECARSGKPVPEYRLKELIGKGSFGRVYKANDLKTSHVVAVKIIDVDEQDTLNPKLQDTYSEFLKEINALRLLSESGAKNVNTFIEALPVGQALWMVTEYCAGGSVATLMKPTAPGGLQEKWIVPILREVSLGIHWVHKQGIIHRDIKCANVLITEVGGVQLCDFGVAGIVETKFDKRTTFIGTLHWMAPELFDQNAQYGTEVDIWAFGSMIYEIASGLPPNVRSNVRLPQFGEYLREHLPRLTGDQYSEDLKSLVAFCLEDDPTKRPSIEQIQQHPYILNTESLYPTSSLAALVKAFKLWEDRGGSRKSLFAGFGAQAPADLGATSLAADEWNFSTTLAFDEQLQSERDGRSEIEAVRDVYGTTVDFPSNFSGEDTTRPKTKGRRRPPPQALAAMKAPLEKVFDPNTISNYDENSRAYYGRPMIPPPSEPPVSDLPLRDDSLHATLRESLIDLDASLGGADLSNFADMGTIKPAPAPGPRASMDNNWSFSTAAESLSHPRAPLSDPADLNNGRHAPDWSWPTSIPPASANPEFSHFPFSDERPRLLHHETEPAILPSQGYELEISRDGNDRMSVGSLIDLDMSMPEPNMNELARPSTSHSDVASITGSEMGGVGPFDLERHTSVYAPLPLTTREPSIYVSEDSEFAQRIARATEPEPDDPPDHPENAGLSPTSISIVSGSANADWANFF